MQAQAPPSYVTGAHALKFGWQNDFGSIYGLRNTTTRTGSSISFRRSHGCNGRSLTPSRSSSMRCRSAQTTHLSADMGIYAQDKWTFKRATINAGVRFDYFKNNFPEQHLGPTRRSFADRNVTIPEAAYGNMKDITPRVGVALRSVRQRQDGAQGSLGQVHRRRRSDQRQPDLATLSYIANRSWTPRLPFGDPNYYTPQCDLLNNRRPMATAARWTTPSSAS